MKNLAVLADEERHPGCILPLEDAVGFLHFTLRIAQDRSGSLRIAQDRVIEFKRHCKFRIGFHVVAAGSEISHVELPNFLATLTE